MNRILWMVTAAATMLGATSAPAAGQIEVEADPLAYAMNGFSVHVAAVLGSARVSVGTFGVDIPEWAHGNTGWDATMRGAGVKVDYLGSRIDGAFVGVEGGYMRTSYGVNDESVERRGQVGVGVRGGYRYAVGQSGLYLAPWVGLGYTFRGGDIQHGDHRFEDKPFTVFPTIHVGWRF